MIEQYEFDEKEFWSDIGQMSKEEYLLHFMEQIRQYLKDLTNQSVAKLLLLLMEQGLEFADEQELQYWINVLEQQSMRRIAQYFSASEKYSKKEILGLSALLGVLQIKSERKNDIKSKKFFANLQKVVEKDYNSKQKNKTQSPQQQQNEVSINILKNKMTAAGVEEGGRYWNHVLNDYEIAFDKNSFVQNWQPKNNIEDIQEINYLRKIENDKNYQTEEEQQLRKQENEQQQEQQRQADNRSKIQKEKEQTRQKNKQLINQEFSNRRNRKAVTKMAEKKGHELTEEDIKKIKIKIISGKSGR